jgi:transposase-like protein
MVKDPTSLVEAIRYFSDPDRAFNFVARLRWPTGEVTCPRCGHGEHSFISTRHVWKCKGCRKTFSLKVGTIFEDSPLGWDKWLPGVWLIANSKNSVSSHELGRALNVTQKTAWFMLHRIRDAMETRTFTKLSGTVEVDETHVGGEAKNMHEYKRVVMRAGGKRVVNKVPVQGARERETGKVTAMVVSTGKGYTSNAEKWFHLA